MSLVRVVAEHEPCLFALLGIYEEAECLPQMQIQDATYYRVRATPRWVLYRRAITGSVAYVGFQPGQKG